MLTIIHKIKLRDINRLDEFKEWVLTADYKACDELNSVLAFEVALVSDVEHAPFHFVEIIHLTSLAEFEADMATLLFQSLVVQFNQMAEIIEEVTATRIGDGYQL